MLLRVSVRLLACAGLVGGVLAVAQAAAPAPDRPEIQFLQSVDALHDGQFNRGLDIVRGLVQKHPDFALAQLLYGQLLAERSGVAGTVAVPTGPADSAALANLQAEYQARVKASETAPTPGEVPNNILTLAPTIHYAVVVDLRRSRLYLLSNGAHGLKLLRSYYASIARDGFGKVSTGDMRTPVGIYHARNWRPGERLGAIYGAGAFPLTYPNAWDRDHGRTGYGIWLHGVPRSSYVRPPRTTEGCVALANDDLLALRPYLAPGTDTPVILSDDLRWQSPAASAALRATLERAVTGWRKSWSARDTTAYLAYYAPDFRTADGMTRAAFAREKRTVNASKRYIKIQVKNLSLFRYPAKGELVLARFTQVYQSNNYSQTSLKQQFWRREPNGQWKIVFEVQA